MLLSQLCPKRIVMALAHEPGITVFTGPSMHAQTNKQTNSTLVNMDSVDFKQRPRRKQSVCVESQITHRVHVSGQKQR